MTFVVVQWLINICTLSLTVEHGRSELLRYWLTVVGELISCQVLLCCIIDDVIVEMNELRDVGI